MRSSVSRLPKTTTSGRSGSISTAEQSNVGLELAACGARQLRRRPDHRRQRKGAVLKVVVDEELLALEQRAELRRILIRVVPRTEVGRHRYPGIALQQRRPPFLS